MHGQTTAHLHRERRVLRRGQERLLPKRLQDLHRHGRERLLLKRLQDLHRHLLRQMRLQQVDGQLALEPTMAHGPKNIGLSIIESLQILSRFTAKFIMMLTGAIACATFLLGPTCTIERFFVLVEQNKQIITFKILSETRVPTLPNVKWTWIASHIWTFRGKWMTNKQLRRRLALAQSEEFNGVELRRSLFVEYMGGSIEMQKSERAYFINCPKCQKDEDLQDIFNNGNNSESNTELDCPKIC